MTPDDVANRLKEIEKAAHDDEVAHSMEDALYADLLAAIAEGKCTSPAACASLALTSEGIDFARWCA